MGCYSARAARIIAIWWSQFNRYGLIKCIAIHQTAIVSEFIFLSYDIYKAVGTYNRISDNIIFPTILHNGSFAAKCFPGYNNLVCGIGYGPITVRYAGKSLPTASDSS